MTHNDNLETRIKSTLNASVENLDATTRSRLASARAHALEAQPRSRNYWIPLGGAVTASIIVSALMLFNPTQPQDVGEDNLVLLELDESLELLTSEEEIELYQDLEFYRWLDDIQILENRQHAG